MASPGRNRKFVGLEMPAELAAELARAAEAAERTVSAEVRLAVRRHLRNESARPTEPDASKDRVVKEPAHAGG